MHETDKQRAERQAQEIEENQTALRESIAESQRLSERTEEILQRHRKERHDSQS